MQQGMGTTQHGGGERPPGPGYAWLSLVFTCFLALFSVGVLLCLVWLSPPADIPLGLMDDFFGVPAGGRISQEPARNKSVGPASAISLVPAENKSVKPAGNISQTPANNRSAAPAGNISQEEAAIIFFDSALYWQMLGFVAASILWMCWTTASMIIRILFPAPAPLVQGGQPLNPDGRNAADAGGSNGQRQNGGAGNPAQLDAAADGADSNTDSHGDSALDKAATAGTQNRCQIRDTNNEVHSDAGACEASSDEVVAVLKPGSTTRLTSLGEREGSSTGGHNVGG